MNRSAQVQAGEHLVIAVIDGDAMRWARELHCHPQPGDIPAANGRADVEVLVQLRGKHRHALRRRTTSRPCRAHRATGVSASPSP